MQTKNEIIKRLAREEGIDQRVVRLAVDSPLKFSRERMADPDDWRPVMIRYFCKFVPKYGVLKELEEQSIKKI